MNKYSPDLSSQFKDKIIIITGSTQGSGAETAKLFAARGAKAITICGRQENKGIQSKTERRLPPVAATPPPSGGGCYPPEI